MISLRAIPVVTFVVAAAVAVHAADLEARSATHLSAAQIQGRELAAEIMSESPVTNLSETGILRIRNSQGTTNIPINFHTGVDGPKWYVIYTATPRNGSAENLEIIHQNGRPNEYNSAEENGTTKAPATGSVHLSRTQLMTPFAGSDFWIADLGLQFFHWPEQKVIGRQNRRMRNCTVLESDNPNPSPGAYSKVVAWIDNQTLGIIYAEAYDRAGKLLKVFEPKSLKKVNGQWELQDIEIRNVQTHSRTWIRFNLNGNS
ncbi:MAG: outer membrane lipoprotein-sorting protein [Limisphaerales bacterium]